jgi:hypothetical protein
MRGRIPLIKALILCGTFLVCASSVDAQPQPQGWAARLEEDDRTWARRSGLSVTEVRRLRLVAGVTNDNNAYIDHLDVRGLRARNHILLVTAAGNGHCLELYVFRRRGSSFQRLWSVSGMPEGAGFCRGSPRNPEAYVTRDAKIRVKIDYADYEALLANVETEYFTYVWNGRTYRLASRRRVRNRNPTPLNVVPSRSTTSYPNGAPTSLPFINLAQLKIVACK